MTFQFSAGNLLRFKQSLNNLLSNEKDLTFDVLDLSAMQRGNANYNNLISLKMSDFSDIRDSVQKSNQSIFNWLIDKFAVIIYSKFISSSVNLKRAAEQETTQKYEQFMKETAGLLSDNTLKILIYGSETEDSTSASNSIIPLNEAKNNLEFKDALSKALNYLFMPDGKYAETYSRLFYALLGDGLVLLLGFSLRRKNTAIYRIKNRRDLTNEEPRLIKEALYNLSAREAPAATEFKIYSIENLLYFLNDFISCFEIESYMQDAKLDMSFSLVCTDKDAQKKLNSNYRELIYTLQALKYIKPLSTDQYEFFTRYKRNKAVTNSENVVSQIHALPDDCIEYHYLMTTGFALYFSEIVNDLFENIENRQIRNELKEEFEGFGLIQPKNVSGSATTGGA